MSIPQHITYNVGGTISVEHTSRPSAATVSVYTGTGAKIVDAQSATVSTINTTLNGAVSDGATSIVVASATGLTEGEEFFLRSPTERCRVKSASGTTITLWRPLRHDHATGVTIEGTTITYAVSSSEADTLFFDGRAEWTLDSNIERVTALECTKYPLDRLATFDDLAAENSRADEIFADDDDHEQILDAAHELVLGRIGNRGRVRVFTGEQSFISATVLAAYMMIYRRRPGDAAEQLYDRYKIELAEELDRLVANIPRDADQDGDVESDERMSLRSARLLRA